MNHRFNSPGGINKLDYNGPEQQTEEERIFFNEVSDEQLEAVASSPMVTFTLSVVLFACQFCPSELAGHPRDPAPAKLA